MTTSFRQWWHLYVVSCGTLQRPHLNFNVVTRGAVQWPCTPYFAWKQQQKCVLERPTSGTYTVLEHIHGGGHMLHSQLLQGT